MPNDLRLKVVASSIDGKGIVKLDSDSFRSLKLDECMPVTITYGAKSMELVARVDSIFSPSTARLMKADMADLRLEAGMEITVARKNGFEQKPDKPSKKGRGRKGRKSKAASLDRF
jgi:hypothetical protein